MADNKKKPIKQCRIKTDTCFKWHCLGKVFGLNLDDIGLMYMISQIQDDESNLRYTLIEEEILDMFKETEAEWLALHGAKMKSDPLYRIAFSDLNGQRKATTNHYKAEVERRKAYNQKIQQQNEEEGELKEDVTTSDEFIEKQTEEYQNMIFDTKYFINKKTYQAEYKIAQENNVPTENEMVDLKEEFDNETLIKLIEIGNKEEWQRHYTTILQELYEESKQKTETPFDCLKGDEENENSNNEK